MSSPPTPTYIKITQNSGPDDFDGYPGANSFICILLPEGGIETIRYDAFVALLFKQESYRHMIDHARGGICEEAGEVSSWLKQHVVYGKPLDSLSKEGYTLRHHIVEELGDGRFFQQVVMNILGITEQEVLQQNANKLCVRYKQLRYSDEDAIGRADKADTSES